MKMEEKQAKRSKKKKEKELSHKMISFIYGGGQIILIIIMGEGGPSCQNYT